MTDDAYYWSGGQRISLGAAAKTAVDTDAAERAGVPKAEMTALRKVGRELVGSMLLVDRKSVVPSTWERLESIGAIQPVFTAEDGSLVVVLPEVRVEVDDPVRRGALDELLSKGDVDATVSEAKPGRVVLRPSSGRGADALALANKIAEDVHPDLAQARFLRVVAHPDQTRRK